MKILLIIESILLVTMGMFIIMRLYEQRMIREIKASYSDWRITASDEVFTISEIIPPPQPDITTDPALLEPLYFKVVDDTIAYLTKYEILKLTNEEQSKIAKLLVIRQFGFPVPVAKEMMIANLPKWAVERGKE